MSQFSTKVGGAGSFLPEDYVTRKSELRANILTLGLFALVLGGVAAGFVVTQAQFRDVVAKERQVEAAFDAEAKKIEQLNALEAQRSSVLEKAEVTAALSERTPRWALLADMELRAPADLFVDQFTLKSKKIDAPPPQAQGSQGVAPAIKTLTGLGDSGKKGEPARPKVEAPKYETALTIAGTAARNNDIADFLGTLRDSTVFNNVELQFIREAKEDQQLFRKFEINATLRNDVDIEKLAASLRALTDLKMGKVPAPDAGTKPSVKPDEISKAEAKGAEPLPGEQKSNTKTAGAEPASTNGKGE